MGPGAQDRGPCHTGQCSPSPSTFCPLGSLMGCCALLPRTQRRWALPLLGDFGWGWYSRLSSTWGRVLWKVRCGWEALGQNQPSAQILDQLSPR